MPDFCQTMSSLERVLKAYEQAGRALPLQYQCQPALQPVAILIAIERGPRGRVLVEPDGVEPTTSCLQSRRSTN